MLQSTTTIGFDQHAHSLVAAVLLPDAREPAIQPLSPDLPHVGRFIDKVLQQGPVRCCYEAGPCGFELYRFLTGRGIPCEVIAPALIPRRPGDRVKTDRRDAIQLAVLYRAGALTAIHVPTDAEEAARDLVRTREDVRRDVLRARQRLGTFILRHGRRFTVTKSWGAKYDQWVRTQQWTLPALAHTPSTLSPRRRRGPRPTTRHRGRATPARDPGPVPGPHRPPALFPRYRHPQRLGPRRRTR